ncbi:hypothetical protein PIIN_06395 [Serendipita indica DSM 11827]|uniref:Uncharacterized protein n=1 Tax=Serendipita indica (strain DSM 11827) TaxID=1109443 RepID=G4TMB8_SERID|nr:hypothetical protein PIIN_06395 [Serendipita indica DSM 11827]
MPETVAFIRLYNSNTGYELHTWPSLVVADGILSDWGDIQTWDYPSSRGMILVPKRFALSHLYDASKLGRVHWLRWHSLPSVLVAIGRVTLLPTELLIDSHTQRILIALTLSVWMLSL